jgi:predicted small lipoprotein YifL
MNPIARPLVAAMLLASLAACGNKGPLVHPSAPQSEVPAPASTAAPVDPTQELPPADSTPPPDAGGAAPANPPPDGSGGGNG